MTSNQFIIGISAAASVCSAVSAREGEVILAGGGTAKLAIVSREGAAPSASLAKYLSRMSGAKFAIRTEGDGPAIFVGTQADFPKFDVGAGGKLGVEEFVIRPRDGSLYLIGGGDQGVSHAVFTFLRELGCRWYFPGDLWEEIPRQPTIRGAWDIRGKPDFSLGRRIWYGFGAYAKNRDQWETWNRHNRMGGPEEMRIGHTWAGLNPDRDFEGHPDWFALVDGKRSAEKPCYSHPEVIDKMIGYARKAAEAGQTCITLSAPDGLGFCECEKCRAVFLGAEPFEEHRTLFAKRDDGTVVNITSETLFGAVNRVAEAVCKDHPGVTLACYAYSAYSHPPSFALHPNVYIQTTTAYRRTSLDLEGQLSLFGKKAQKLGIREYYSVFQWDWDWPDPGKMTPETLREDLRFFHANGVDAVNAEASNNWAARGLGYYVASQLMWDVDQETAPLLDDFYSGAFGPAAKAMERYFVRWYGESAAASDPGDLPGKAKAFDKSVQIATLRDAFRDLDEATKATPGGSRHRNRVDAIRAYLHYILLRYRLELAANSGRRDLILDAIRAEAEFGGRLSDLNLVHTRALIGKAFPRRFREFADELEGIDTTPWRSVGIPPDAAELEKLWESDRDLLGL